MVVSTIFFWRETHAPTKTTWVEDLPTKRFSPLGVGEFLIFPGVPTNSPQVLKIHCGTGEVDLIGPVFQGDWNLRFRCSEKKEGGPGDRHKKKHNVH